jgi:hypothetical protein
MEATLANYTELIQDINNALIKFRSYLNPDNMVFFQNLKGVEDEITYICCTDSGINYIDKIEGSDKGGVYFIFALNNNRKPTVYIGKSSMNQSIGQRLAYHSYGFKKEDKAWVWGDNYTVEAIKIIPLPKENVFIAPSLEEFLIVELKGEKLSNSIGNI